MCTAAPAPEPAREPKPPARPRFLIDLGWLMSLATVPRRPGFGLVAGGGVRWPWVSLELELRVDLPSVAQATYTYGRSYENIWMFSGALVPCLHAGWFAGCGVVSAGEMAFEHAWNGQAGQAVGYQPHAWAGLRAGFEIPLARRFALRATGDLLVPLLRQHGNVVSAEQRASPGVSWMLPPVQGALGLRLVAFFGAP